MFEYQDDFLMGCNKVSVFEEGANQFCHASNAAEEQLAELAALVGSGSKLKPAHETDQIEMVDAAAPLEFDLESELSKAFNVEPEAEAVPSGLPEAYEPAAIEQALAQSMEPADLTLDSEPADLPAPEVDAFQHIMPELEVAPEAVVEAAPEMAAPVQPQMDYSDPAAEVDEASLSSDSDFSDMIADELDRALAEEVAADASLLGETADAHPILEESAMDAELAKLMGDGGQEEVAPVAEHPAPPIPQSVQEPWQTAEIVDVPEIPGAPELEIQSVSPPEWEAPQMSDYEATGMDFSDPAAELDVPSAQEPMMVPDKADAVNVEAVMAGGAAIGAAATASAAKPAEETAPPVVGHFEPTGDLPEYEDGHGLTQSAVIAEGANKRKNGRRAAFAIVAVALLGGTAALGWNVMGNNATKTPVILASTEPVKVKPKDAGGEVVPNQDQAVYKSVEGKDDKVVKQAKLKDGTEKSIAVNVGSTGEKSDQRIAKNDATDQSNLEIKPRRVRTVVVKPDGTIVSTTADQTTANSSSDLKIETPTLALQPTVPSLEQTASLQKSLQPTAQQAVTFNAPKAEQGDATKTAVEIPKPTVVKPVKIAKVATPAPKPKPVKKAVKPVAKKPAPKPASSSLPTVSSPYAVQISSQRSSAAAKKSYSTLSRRYASVLRGKGVDIRKAVIEGKGTYYRVRIPANSRGAANQLCSQLKARGGSCFVTR